MTFATVLALVSANGKTVTWSISPAHQEMQRYYGDTFLFKENGKWGIIKAGDVVIVPPKHDFITPFVNGYALIGTKDGTRLLLEGILGEDGSVTGISDKYYLHGTYQYFSEDKLVVMNKSGKYGYINPAGDIVVRCQFDNALPFKEGYAPVKQGNYMKFIRENYDRNASRNVLTVDFHYGEMTAAGCFSNNLAPVAYNNDFALINTKGQKVRKIKEQEFKQACKSNNAAPEREKTDYSVSSQLEIYSENGKYGLREGEKIVVSPQFDSFPEIYSDGYVLAGNDGNVGLLKLVEGDVSVQAKVNGVLKSELEVDRKGDIEQITFECTMPGVLDNCRILVDDGGGRLIDRTEAFARKGNTGSITFSPSVVNDAEVCVNRIIVENEGIILADYSQRFDVVYPVKLRVGIISPDTIRAAADDRAKVSATIHNDSRKPVTVNVTWSNGANNHSVEIPAHGYRTVQTEFKVEVEFTRNVSLTLSTGEKSDKKITFIPYF